MAAISQHCTFDLRQRRWVPVLMAVLLLLMWVPGAAPAKAAVQTITVTPTDDAYVDEAAPTTNFGTSASLLTNAISGAAKQSFLKFSVSGIPAGAVLTHATLRLAATAAGSQTIATAPTTTSDWTESTVTWDTRPAFSTAAYTDKLAVKKATAVSFNVTGAVPGNGVVSLAVVQTTSGTAVTNFSSKEGAAAPQLIISYLPAGVATTPCASASPPATYSHVIWIFMENKKYTQVIGSPAAPYTTDLAHACATATNYADAGRYPSLPNYIAATSGSTNGFTKDVLPSVLTTTADNIFRQVRTAGLTERSYAESMPANCYQAISGKYAARHVPALYYVGADDATDCQSNVVPLGTPTSGAFASALQSGTLPNFSFITPNLTNDGHSGTTLSSEVSASDLFLSTWLPPILESPTYTAGNTAIVVVWDEDTPMPNVWIAPSVVPGTVVTNSGHYSLLRTTEEMLGISSYLLNAASAPSMRGPMHL